MLIAVVAGCDCVVGSVHVIDCDSDHVVIGFDDAAAAVDGVVIGFDDDAVAG